MFQVNLHFTDDALRLIAKKAMAKNTGARGLRALLENVLTEAMFEVHPTYGNIGRYSMVFPHPYFPTLQNCWKEKWIFFYLGKEKHGYDECEYECGFGFLYGQVPDKADVDNIKGVLVDEEAVGPVNGVGCGAKILYRDDGGALEHQARAICL